MDKQKQIEEMAKDLKEEKLYALINKTSYMRSAENLINAGYRKIRENEVVLTREEYKKWLEFVISYLILFVCEHRRGLGEDPLWQPNEDEREKIPLDLDNMFKKIMEGK